MSQVPSPERFRESIIEQVDALVRSCEESQRPLEMDPAHSELFELFVSVEKVNGLDEEGEIGLSADGLCAALAERWDLKNAAETSVRNNSQLSQDQLARMRSMWSILRMWMEWTYAWQRWSDFHPESRSGTKDV